MTRKARRRALRAAAAVGGMVALLAADLFRWAATARPGAGVPIRIEIEDDPAAALAAAGAMDGGLRLAALLALTRPFVTIAPGAHLLSDALTPAEALRRLARLGSRRRARVVVPEGWNVFQVAARLERHEVCAAPDFERAARSAEGWLFPATYELLVDSVAEEVAATMRRQMERRLGALRGAHPGLEWSDEEVLTVASIVQMEAAHPEELGLVASVLVNRLERDEFRPARRLQSDPTAGYGCRVHPELASCRGFDGRITPELLRDPLNPYNTYRHPGLPPTPIASPGEAAIRAVLAPPRTDFFFFVARGDGRHTFTRTLAEHEAATGAAPAGR